MALADAKPDDVRELARYRGMRRRYAQLRYGSPGSVRVTVVLDEISPGDADLYVDADRNRRIEDKDRVQGAHRTWRVPLDVAVVDGETTRYVRRAVIFRRGLTGLTFSVAAAGYLEGNVRLEGREHTARRMDGDGNGTLTDPQDRLWIDLNDDGQWDPTSEQFLYATILSVGSGRYAVRSDALGTRLALEPLEGTGHVRLALAIPENRARVVDLSATLVGRDGSAVGLGGDQAGAVVPVGDYRLHTVTLTLEPPGGGPTWSYVFSDDGGRPGQGWQRVEKDARVDFDPIGTIEFRTGFDPKKACRAGEDLTVSPRLYTGAGLLINTCYRGTPVNPQHDDGPCAEIALTTSDSQKLSTARSGFA
jgi:hypothetical protein